MTRRIRTTLAVAIITGLLPLAASEASASPGGQEQPSAERFTYEMVLTEFDPVVAEANGAEFTRNGDLYTFRNEPGKPVTVPGVGTARAARAQDERAKGITASDIVYGNCGNSFMDIVDVSGYGWGNVAIGFTLYSKAVSYSWNYYTNNEWTGYFRSYSGSGSLFFRTSWSRNDNRYTDYGVVFGGAYLKAGLANGGTCVSNGPTDSSFVS